MGPRSEDRGISSLNPGASYRSLDVIQTVLYHQLGNLPEPEFTHKFW